MIIGSEGNNQEGEGGSDISPVHVTVNSRFMECHCISIFTKSSTIECQT